MTPSSNASLQDTPLGLRTETVHHVSHSTYDHRDRPAYGRIDWPPYANRNISQWWTAEHDELIKRLIDKWQWHWYVELARAVTSMTPPFNQDTLRSFQEQEKGQLGVWYNKIVRFAVTRAKSLGLTSRIRAPQRKTCPLCGEEFVEDSLPAPLTERLGMDHLDFCAPCLKSTVYRGTGNQALSREQTLEYLRDLTRVLQQIPHQGFGEGIDDFHDMDSQQILAVLQVLQRKPRVNRVKELFGSWLQALIEAGVLDEDARRTSRGTQCVAKDGHVCFSLGERTIDDFLHARGITHDKEPSYPETNYRADFAVNGILIEYFGLQGDPDYDNKIKEKQEICKKYDMSLISIYASDLVNITRLESKLRTSYQARQLCSLARWNPEFSKRH